MAQFTKLFQTFMFIGLIVFSMLAFSSFLQSENNVDESQRLTNNTLLSNTFSQLNQNFTSSGSRSQNQKTIFETENPTAGFGSFLLYSILSAGRVFNSMIVGVFNTLIKLPVVFLGLDPVVVGILSTLLVVAIIFGLWSVYKLGG